MNGVPICAQQIQRPLRRPSSGPYRKRSHLRPREAASPDPPCRPPPSQPPARPAPPPRRRRLNFGALPPAPRRAAATGPRGRCCPRRSLRHRLGAAAVPGPRPLPRGAALPPPPPSEPPQERARSGAGGRGPPRSSRRPSEPNGKEEEGRSGVPGARGRGPHSPPVFIAARPRGPSAEHGPPRPDRLRVRGRRRGAGPNRPGGGGASHRRTRPSPRPCPVAAQRGSGTEAPPRGGRSSARPR